VADHAITDSAGATVGEITPAIEATRTQACIGTGETAVTVGATAAAARIASVASAVKAASVAREPEWSVATVAAEEVAATEVARVTVRPSVAAIVKDHVAKVATSRARDLIKVRAAIRTVGLIRVAASIKARDPTRRLEAIRMGVRTLRAQTRLAGLIRMAGSTPAHAATKGAQIKADGSMRVRATNQLVKKVGRTKHSCATMSAIALQRALAPTPTEMALLVAIDQIALVANAVAAEDAVGEDAVVVAEAKAAIVTAHRRAEHPLQALMRSLPGRRTRSPHKARLCRRATVPITVRNPAMGILGIIRVRKKPGSGSRTIVHRPNRSSVRRQRNTRRSNLRTGSRLPHHNM